MENQAIQVMTEGLVTTGTEDSARKACQVMQEHGIRHLPVVDRAGNVVGILSDRDILRASKWHRKNRPVEKDRKVIELDPGLKAKDIMHSPVKSVDENVSVQQVAQRMLDERVSALLVTSSGGRYRGIVTTDDLLKYLSFELGKNPASSEFQVQSFFDEDFLRSIGY